MFHTSEGTYYLESAMPTKSNITDFICRHIQYLYYSTTTSVMFKITITMTKQPV